MNPEPLSARPAALVSTSSAKPLGLPVCIPSHHKSYRRGLGGGGWGVGGLKELRWRRGSQVSDCRRPSCSPPPSSSVLQPAPRQIWRQLYRDSFRVGVGSHAPLLTRRSHYRHRPLPSTELVAIVRQNCIAILVLFAASFFSCCCYFPLVVFIFVYF